MLLSVQFISLYSESTFYCLLLNNNKHIPGMCPSVSIYNSGTTQCSWYVILTHSDSLIWFINNQSITSIIILSQPYHLIMSSYDQCLLLHYHCFSVHDAFSSDHVYYCEVKSFFCIQVCFISLLCEFWRYSIFSLFDAHKIVFYIQFHFWLISKVYYLFWLNFFIFVLFFVTLKSAYFQPSK